MTSRTRWLLLLISTPVVLFVAVGGILGATSTAREQSFPQLRVFNDVVTRIIGAYVQPVNPDAVMDGAMRGLTDALDPSSAFLSADEVAAIDAGTAPPAGDTGLVVMRQFYLRVLGVRDGSPAARAGLRTGDFVRMIDGQATRDMSSITGMRRLRGAPGLKVSLLVLRGTTIDPHVVEIVREATSAPLVTSKRLPGGEGYLRVTSFAPGAAAALAKQADGLRAAGAPSLIVDLRGIADGAPDEGIAAARPFIKSGVLATLVARNAPKVVTSAAAGDGTVTIPVAVLVTNGTAGAAELLASALQSNRRAELVGEPTAGLAAVQKLVKLQENRGLWLTFARYTTPDGTALHERGLRPDVFVESPAVAFGDTTPAADEALSKATDRLKTSRK